MMVVVTVAVVGGDGGAGGGGGWLKRWNEGGRGMGREIRKDSLCDFYRKVISARPQAWHFRRTTNKSGRLCSYGMGNSSKKMARRVLGRYGKGLGAIFEQGTDEVQSAFKFAMFNHNKNTTMRKFELQAFVDVINTADAYKLSRLSRKNPRECQKCANGRVINNSPTTRWYVSEKRLQRTAIESSTNLSIAK
ncbi:hypothetical protein M0804_007928 [Polistes exclamans]|nr:hypothetical protein M0804_007928 [Polistes exclamans]